jgi:hypothetical protein
MTHEEIIAYNLRDAGTACTVFEYAQPERIKMARGYVQQAMAELGRPGRIVEPGCSSGDISGFFSGEHDVVGFDVVPAAVAATRSRWPRMKVFEAKVEVIAPMPCDVLVLCEFLEHVTDPLGLARGWLPLAEYAVIGHPLHDPGDWEPGHLWSYTVDDFKAWFTMGGHELLDYQLFQMGGCSMVIGLGRRVQ